VNNELKESIVKELGGLSVELYDELLNDFVAHAMDQLIILKEAITSSNDEIVGRISHSLKGSSGNLRLRDIEKIFTYINNAAKNGHCEKSMLDQCRDIERLIGELL
jgi:HPt (histidine-containing phosphotransfer) domain-containing protein